MIDTGKMNRTEFGESGEFCPVCNTLHDAKEILQTADRIPDESTKATLIEGAKKMIQNVLDALDGRKTEGLVELPEEED